MIYHRDLTVKSSELIPWMRHIALRDIKAGLDELFAGWKTVDE